MTEASADNGCLHVVPGSRDNTSTRRRGAMIFHFASHGTVDHAEEHFGFTIHDWMPVRRALPPVQGTASAAS